MQNLYFDTRPLDRAAVEHFGITEDIMMENAAAALEQAIIKQCGTDMSKQAICIITGSGNNGADGMALARRIAGSVHVTVVEAITPHTPLCIQQKERAKKSGVIFTQSTTDTAKQSIANANILVDCIFGSGFHGEIDSCIQEIIDAINNTSSFVIACDIPSAGLVHANVTVTMGALKTPLYDEAIKDNTGTIICAPLGITRSQFESCAEKSDTHLFVLEETDVRLPIRTRCCVNKGSFGHAVIAQGNKPGAALLAAQAATAFGAGLVTLCGAAVTQNNGWLPDVMTAKELPVNASAFASGMGLGSEIPEWVTTCVAQVTLPIILDADWCGSALLPDLLKQRASSGECKTVITPHPKEFARLLTTCGLGDFSVNEVVRNRIDLLQTFCRAYPHVVIILKGASPIIAEYNGSDMVLYINPLGNQCLAKGGSGDVLSGLICALLAQGYTAMQAALQASLAHALASQRIQTSYGMTPLMLIDAVRYLETSTQAVG